jgi:hypothetical protein
VAAPGGEVVLDLHWRASEKIERDYTVFTHLLGQDHNPRTGGPVWGQHDSQPADGGLPTTQWFVAERIVDRHRLVIDPGAPEGDYRIEVGMYTLDDGARLLIRSEDGRDIGDHLLLEAAVRVR